MTDTIVRSKSFSFSNIFSGNSVSNVINMGSLVGGETEFALRVNDNIYFMETNNIHDP